MSVSAAYPNPPITEAIIDVRIAASDGDIRSILDDLSVQMTEGFPLRAPLVESVGQLAFGPEGGTASVKQRSVGWKVTSSDAKQVVQFRSDGFTFSQLAPYKGWVSFKSNACDVWGKYRGALRENAITRLAVRYVNRIDVPGDRVELKDYFRTFPEIAPELPQQMEGFFVQVQLAFAELKASCLINQTIVPPHRPGVISLVLDVDLFRNDEVPQSENGIWEYFERLRHEKDRIFEACITDSTRELFRTCPS